MIITTNDLNNIETKITTPQIEGIEFINTMFDEDENPIGINTNYNSIAAIIENGKLPIIKYNNNFVLGHKFIARQYINDNKYYIDTTDKDTLYAENATTNMVLMLDEAATDPGEAVIV